MSKGQFESAILNWVFWLFILGFFVYFISNYIVQAGTDIPGWDSLFG